MSKNPRLAYAKKKNKSGLKGITGFRARHVVHLLLFAMITCRSTPVLSVTNVNFTTSAPLYELLGAGPGDINAGDVDGDGDLDILVSTFGSANSDISVLLNDGAGNFSDNVGFSLLNAPHGFTLQQMDNDAGGNLDIIVAVQDYSGGNLDGQGPAAGVDIFYGDGSGSFGAGGGVGNTPNVHISVLEPTNVASADFDGNGVNDLAVSRELGGVVVFLGQIDANTGDLSFTGPSTISAGAASDILVDDFDGDSHWDIATPGAVYFGDGAGGFSAGTGIGGTWAVASGDINGDAFKDLAVLSGTTFGSTLRVKLGNADRTFTDFQTYSGTGTNIDFNDVYIADFNQDGYGDVVIADGRSHVMKVFLQNCSGQLLSPISLATPLNEPTTVFAGDLNTADSFIDIVTSLHNSGETPYAAVFLQIAPASASGNIQLCTTAKSVSEGSGSVLLKIVREDGADGIVSVDYTTAVSAATNAATPADDFTTTMGAVTFNTGELEKTISIPIIDDANSEGDEVFPVDLSNPQGGASLGVQTEAIVTIIDNDNNALPTANAGLDQTVSEGANVFLDGRGSTDPDGAIVSYSWTQSRGTPVTLAGGSTASPAFTAPSVATNTILTFQLTVTDNNGASDADLVDITVTPTPMPGTLSFEVPGNTTPENGVGLTLSVIRTEGDAGQVSVDFATVDGTATAGLDYQATSGTLTFADGELRKDIHVVLLDDQDYEGDETFQIELSNAQGGAVLGIQGTAQVTITENDPIPPSGVLHFSGQDFTVLENQVNSLITVTRSNGSYGQVSVDYATTDGTATADKDYQLMMGTLIFEDGETSGAIEVPILDDIDYEGDEVFHVQLSNVQGGAALGTMDTAQVTIVENDPIPPAGSLRFSGTAYSIAEDGNSLLITVIRVGGDFGIVTVDYESSDGTALSGADFSPISGTLTFANGIISQTFDVAILDDTQFENDESFNLRLFNVSGGAVLGVPAEATVTVKDNDPQQPSTTPLPPQTPESKKPRSGGGAASISFLFLLSILRVFRQRMIVL